MGASVNLQQADDEDGATYRPMAEINITPMVDVMLVLLIIFMVAAPLMVAGVPVELPKTTAPRLGQSKKPMVVTLTPDGRFQIRDEFVDRRGADLAVRARDQDLHADLLPRAHRSTAPGSTGPGRCCACRHRSSTTCSCTSSAPPRALRTFDLFAVRQNTL